jgi:hypothetical protein
MIRRKLKFQLVLNSKKRKLKVGDFVFYLSLENTDKKRESVELYVDGKKSKKSKKEKKNKKDKKEKKEKKKQK